MIDSCDMGKVYFELDDSVETREILFEFFEQLGFNLVSMPSLNEPLYCHSAKFANDNLSFTVIWYRNLCHIRIGQWGKSFIEYPFTKIAGSYLPNSGHITLDFYDDKNRTAKISVSNNH